jgi:ring-1,2-phenylacetyl-CoA epoxidase subunit PaaC
MRQFLFSSYQLPLYEEIIRLPDERLAAIAEKSIKEVIYHLRWSSEWVIRLGLGTEESCRRMSNALSELWPYTEELYTRVDYEPTFKEDIAMLWKQRVNDILQQAQLSPPKNATMFFRGKTGRHPHHLRGLLNEMQHMQRTYPGMEW